MADLPSTMKGITVEIGGNTGPLNDALKKVNNTSVSLNSELKQVEKHLKIDPKNTEMLAQKQVIFAEAVKNSKEKLDALLSVQEQIQQQAAKGTISAEQQRAYARELEQAKGIYAANSAELKKMTSGMDEAGNAAEGAQGKLGGLSGVASKIADLFGVKLPPGLEQAAKKFDETKAAGGGLGDKINALAESAGAKLPPGLSKAVNGLGGMTAAALATAAAVAAAVKALIDMATQGAKTADDIATNAIIMGVTNDRYQEFVYMAPLVDTSAETMTSSMSKLTRSMSDARDGSEKVVTAFQKLRVEYKDGTGALRSNEAVFYEIIDALGKVENQTERDAIAMELMGKSARELNPLIDAGSKRMRELAQEAHDVGAVMSGEMMDSYLALADEMDRSKSIGDGLKNTMGSIISPALTQGMALLNDLVAKISTKLQEAQSLEAVRSMLNIVMSIATALGSTLLPMLEGIFNMLNTIFAVVNLILAPVEYLVTMAANLIKLLMGGMGWDEFVDSSEKATNKLLSSWSKSVNAIIGENNKMQDSAKETSAVIGDSLAEGYAKGAEAAEKEYITLAEVNEKIKQSRKDAAKAARSYYTTVEDGNGVVAAVTKKDYEAYQKYAGYVDAHYSGLTEKQKVYLAKQLEQQGAATGKMAGIMDREAVSAAKEGKQSGIKLGGAVAQGVSDGLSFGIGPIKRSVKMITSLIEDGFTGDLEIRSPSRKGIRWGKFTLGAFVDGFDSMRSRLEASVARALDTVGTLGAAPAQMSMAGGYGFAAPALSGRYPSGGEGGMSQTSYTTSYGDDNTAVTIEARSIREINDITRMAQNARMARRSGKKRGR